MTARLDRRLAGLFVAALLGVLLALGLALAPLGSLVVASYAVVVVLLLGLLGRRARTVHRSAVVPGPVPAGRTCSCCTSTVHDPVRVV